MCHAEPDFEFALTHHWWSWSHPKIHDALAVAIMSSVGPQVNQAIKTNRSRRVSPLSIEDLSSWRYLRRHSSHTGRVLTGGNLATVQFLLGISTALSIPLHQIMPDESQMIALMTTDLTRESIAFPDAKLYATYRSLAGNSSALKIDTEIALKAMGSMSTQNDTRSPELRILGVVKSITPYLVAIDQEIENRKGM